MNDIKLSAQDKSYLRDKLNRVARTFALLPPFLDETLAAIMSTAYLVCRVVDSIEDCRQPFDWKKRRFAEVRRLLDDPSQRDELLQLWSTLDWRGLNEEETALMQLPDSAVLWEIYAGIPATFRDIIRCWVTEMAVGMEGTLNPAASPRVIREGELLILHNLEDYNKYCYYVAGTVGYLQTELLQTFYQLSDEIAGRLRHYSLAFGLALQKTNIVKDFLDDLNRGVCYLPYTWMVEIQKKPLETRGASLNWTRHVLFDVKQVLDEAVNYIVSLPDRLVGVRQATLMCLLPAYQTILLAAEKSKTLFTENHHIKISHAVLATCFEDARALAQNDQLLSQYRNQVSEQLERLLGEPRPRPAEVL